VMTETQTAPVKRGPGRPRKHPAPRTWRVVALKAQTVLGGREVQIGEDCTEETMTCGLTWFRNGFLGFEGNVPGEEMTRRERLDAESRMIKSTPDFVDIAGRPGDVALEVWAAMSDAERERFWESRRRWGV